MSRDLARLRWRCRRGLLELDILLGRFLDEQYPTLDVAQQGRFAQLLEQPDEVLMQWFGGASTPPEFAALVQRIR